MPNSYRLATINARANCHCAADTPHGLRQSTFEEIVESEKQTLVDAETRYGKHYRNARACSIFLSRSITSVDASRQEMFGRFFALLKKHHMLALLSTLRLHKVQSMMNLRQVLEAGAAAAFAIANPGVSHFANTDPTGILDPSKELTKKRYRWLEANFPEGSNAVKAKKELINNMSAHANVVSASQTFRVNEKANIIDAPFFDIEDEYHVKADLWLMSSIAVELMDLLYGVNENHGAGAIEFMPDFRAYLMQAAQNSNAMHAEITSTDRYKRAMEKLQSHS
jgi:hypothetical protein